MSLSSLIADMALLCGVCQNKRLMRIVFPRKEATRADDPQALHFRAESGSLEDDSIRHWRAVRRLGSGSTTLASFDYKNPRVQLGIGHSLNRQGDVTRHEVYEYAGAYAYQGPNDGDALAQRRMEERDHLRQYFEAGGNHRAVQPRRSFRLAGHFSATPKQPARGEEARPSIAPRKYLILSVEHTASNNYQAGPGAKSHYENSFVCVRKSIRWRPGRHYHSTPCPDPGPQTAIVVGPPGEEIHTDHLGRVKIQFHWDRLGQFNQFSSPWIRVMTPIAGQRHGQIGLPRIRQEVAVHFLGGNIDRPIITGPAYNGRCMPPWNLPDQRALTGLRSRELGGGQRGNHLLLDDTRGAIQAQLRSDHQSSQLSLGAITRVDDTAGRKDARGEGFELASDAWGVLRAGRGMLISTEARPNAAAHIKDMGETVRRLAIARELHELQADLARQHGAQEKQGQQTEVAGVIKMQNDAIQGAGGGDFPELSAPHLILASPAGIETSTSQSTHIASDQHTAITTGKSLAIASGDSLFASIRKTFRLFVHKAGMKMIAAAGDIDMQALSDSINILSKLNITQTANRITITAKEEVLINGGGSYTKYTADGIEHGTNGGYVNHAATHSFTGPQALDRKVLLPTQGGHDPDGTFIFSS
jgi:type VI secretion system secreted protein VgrG